MTDHTIKTTNDPETGNPKRINYSGEFTEATFELENGTARLRRLVTRDVERDPDRGHVCLTELHDMNNAVERIPYVDSVTSLGAGTEAPDSDHSDDAVLDKRHHNAPKDGNDDPVLPDAQMQDVSCYECGHELGEEWAHADEAAKEKGKHPAPCPECGGNPLPPVGSEVGE
jgi:hypothetical protein